MRTRKGFTLIELLVVIAIIAILAAILFPVFARAREKARASSCQSNQKQIALGFKMYTNDFDEKFPAAEIIATGPGSTTDWGWGDRIFAYTRNWQVYACPSDSTVVSGSRASDFTSYIYNGNLSGMTEADVSTVSTCILTTDYDANMNLYAFGTDPPTTGAPVIATWPATTFKSFNRHSDGANYSFADGHVKWLRPTAPLQTWSGSAPSWDPTEL